MPVNSASELEETFDSVNKALSDASEVALKQPIPGKQFVSMTDAILRIAGYSLTIENNPDQKIQSKRKIFHPWHSDQKTSPMRNSKYRYTRGNFRHFTWHFPNLHRFFGKH